MQPRRKDEQLAQEGRFKNRIIWFLLLMVGLSLYKFATYCKVALLFALFCVNSCTIH